MRVRFQPTVLIAALAFALCAAGLGAPSRRAARQIERDPPAGVRDVDVIIALFHEDRPVFRAGEEIGFNLYIRNKTGKPLTACLAKYLLQLRLTLVKDGRVVPYLKGLDAFIEKEKAAGSCKSLAELPGFEDRELSEEESKDLNITEPDILELPPLQVRPVSSLNLSDGRKFEELPNQFIWTNWYAPLSPGRYELTVERSLDCCGGPSVKSNTVAFEVVPAPDKN